MLTQISLWLLISKCRRSAASLRKEGFRAPDNYDSIGPCGSYHRICFFQFQLTPHANWISPIIISAGRGLDRTPRHTSHSYISMRHARRRLFRYSETKGISHISVFSRLRSSFGHICLKVLQTRKDRCWRGLSEVVSNQNEINSHTCEILRERRM
jgi:hypothetical protein